MAYYIESKGLMGDFPEMHSEKAGGEALAALIFKRIGLHAVPVSAGDYVAWRFPKNSQRPLEKNPIAEYVCTWLSRISDDKKDHEKSYDICGPVLMTRYNMKKLTEDDCEMISQMCEKCC